MFSTILLIISILLCKSILPVILIIATGYLSIVLVFFSNKKYTNEEIEKIDKKTTQISLSLNYSYNFNKKLNSVIYLDSEDIKNETEQFEDKEQIIRIKNSKQKKL